MFTVISVHSRNDYSFVAVVKDNKVLRSYYGVSEFNVADIMRVTGVDVVIAPSLSKTNFNRTYKAA